MRSVRMGFFRFGLLACVAASSVAVQAMDISWNGFGSAYYGQAFSDQLLPHGFSNKHVNFTTFSLMGLNLGASINPDLSFAGQLVALGDPVGATDKFDLIAQWAYVNYEPLEGTSLRLGRQLSPTLLASEYVRVGYLLPFRQIPSVIFNLLPFTRFDGASAYQSVDTPAGKLTLGIFGGAPLLDVNAVALAPAGLTFDFNDLIGAQAVLDGDGWRIRAQASRFRSELTTGAPLPSSYSWGAEQAYSLGYRFDKYNIVSWGEFLLARTPNGTPLGAGKYAEHGHGFYWLGGYRIGRWMPRYTLAQAIETYNVSANGSVTTHTWGLNYHAGNQAVVKVEYELDVVPTPNGGGYFVTQPAGATATSGSAFYAGLDFIF